MNGQTYCAYARVYPPSRDSGYCLPCFSVSFQHFRSQVTQAGTKIAVMRFYVRFYYILRGYRCGLDGVELWGGVVTACHAGLIFFLDLVGSMVRHLWGQVEPGTRRTLAVRAMV